MNRQLSAALLIVPSAAAGACEPSLDNSAPMQRDDRPVRAPSVAADNARRLEAIGHYAESLYGRGKEEDWRAAAIEADELREVVAARETNRRTRLLDPFESQTVAIDSAVRRRDGRALMDVANDLTRRVAEMLRPYSPRVPVDVMLLGFFARELEIASAENDLPRLQVARLSIISTWSSLRPTVAARGGAASVVHFDSIAKDLAQATTSPDFGASAMPILDEVEAMKRVLAR